MKKAYFTLLATLCVIGAQAQNNYLSGIHVGVHSTYNTSAVFQEHTYGNNDLYRPIYTAGFAGGVNVSFSVNDLHEFQIEGQYSIQGQRYTDTHFSNDSLNTATVLDRSINLQYIRIPLVYKYKMPFDAYSAYSNMQYFVGGVYAGMLMDASNTYRVDGAEVPFMDAITSANIYDLEAPRDQMELFERFDYGVILGYGLEFPLTGNLSFTGELRANIGLKDINALEWRYPNSINGYQSSVNVLAGLRLGLVYNFYM